MIAANIKAWIIPGLYLIWFKAGSFKHLLSNTKF